MFRTIALLGLLAAAPLLQASTIYKCTEAGGGTLISNAKVDKSCRAVVLGADLPPGNAAVPNATIRSRTQGAASNPTPASFPKVAEDAQKARDTDRRRILEQELAGEQKNLEAARRDLADQEAVKGDASPQKQQERLLPYRDRVAQHERNITALNRELGAAR